MTTVDLYLRLSIAEDGKDSLQRQEADLRAWAERERLTVRKVWQDKGKSGFKTTTKRTEFDKAINAVLGGEVPTLAVWKLDRLSRRGAGQVGTILDDLETAGGRIVFLKDSLDSSVPTARTMIILVSEQARTESMNTRTRIVSKNESSVAAGFPVAGKRRYGFLPADPANGQRVNTVMHPEEGPQVQALFQDYLHGESVVSLAKRMGWRTLRVRDTLSNPSYAGWVIRGGILYPAHESVARLVDQDTFDAAQARLKDRSDSYRAANTAGGVVKHLMSGIARCGVCDGPLQFRNNYLCLADLSHPTIKGEILEAKVEIALIEHFQRNRQPTADPGAADLAYVSAELRELDARIQDLLGGLQMGLKMADLQPHLQPLLAAQRAAEDRRQTILAQSVQARVIAQVSALLPASKLATGLRIGSITNTLPLDQKRELIRGLFDVVVMPGRSEDRVKITSKRSPAPRGLRWPPVPFY